jgi:hypothetical protein
MVEASRAFYPANRRVFDDSRSVHIYNDAKAYFAAANRQFDIIVAEPSNPWVSGVSGLFTREFYSRVKRYLAPGAVLGQWLHTYELTDDLVLTVLGAIHRNFSDYRIYSVNAADLLIVAVAEGEVRRGLGVFSCRRRRGSLPFLPIVLRTSRRCQTAAPAQRPCSTTQAGQLTISGAGSGAERSRFRAGRQPDQRTLPG